MVFSVFQSSLMVWGYFDTIWTHSCCFMQLPIYTLSIWIIRARQPNGGIEQYHSLIRLDDCRALWGCEIIPAAIMKSMNIWAQFGAETIRKQDPNWIKAIRSCCVWSQNHIIPSEWVCMYPETIGDDSQKEDKKKKGKKAHRRHLWYQRISGLLALHCQMFTSKTLSACHGPRLKASK